MSDLPDIDTSQVSYIAYWNALDDGGIADADFNPEDVTTYGGIDSHTLYDNGIEGELSGVTTDQATTHFRVKSDGWMVVYTDRESQYGLDTGGGNVWGPWEAYDPGGNQAESNLLAQEINSLHANLETSGNFLYSDVGLWNYEHTEASTISIFGWSIEDASGGGQTISGTFSYTDTTTLHKAVAVGRSVKDNSTNAVAYTQFTGDNGTITLSNPSTGSSAEGVRDLMSNGDISPSTDYTMDGEAYAGDGQDRVYASARFLWS